MKTITTGLLFLLTGCLSVARLSDFPKSSNQIPFNELKEREYEVGSFRWTFNFKDGKEYFVELSKKDEGETINFIWAALDSYGYKVIEIDSVSNKIVGKRGLSALACPERIISISSAKEKKT